MSLPTLAPRIGVFAVMLGFLAPEAPREAGAQVTGSLEKMIVELPNGCSTRSTSTQPGGGGAFSFSYACSDQHDVVFTVSFPASVEATSFDGAFYTLAGTADAGAAATWTWKTPASPPGGLFQSSSLRLYLGTYGASAPCAAPEVVKLWLPPGTYTSQATQQCFLGALAAWSSGEPGDTVAWASYWAEAQFNAFHGNLSAVFPSQRARARAVYRMVEPPGPDLEAMIGGRHTFLWEDDPVFPVVVTNRGGSAVAGAYLELTIASPLGFGEVIADAGPGAPAACSWSVSSSQADGTCPLGDLAPGASATVDLEVRLAEVLKDQDLRVTAEAFPADDPAANNRDEQVVSYLKCTAYPEGTIDECALHFLACRAVGLFKSAAAGAGSAAAGLVGGAAAARALLTSPIDVGSFRRLRDEVMAASPGGRRLAALYEEHTGEVVALALADAALQAALLDGVLLWQPLVQALVDGDGSSTITAAQAAALAEALDLLEALGSPALAARIRRERAALDVPTLAGLTADEARARLERTSLRRRLPASP